MLGIGLCMALCGGCGGGGGDNPVATKAVIAFAIALPGGSTEQVGSVDLTMELPDGVSLPLSAGAIPTGASGYLRFSGVGADFAALPNASASMIGTYVPATSTTKARVSIVTNTLTPDNHGLNPGEFATLTCDLTPGTTVDPNAFMLTDVLIGNVTGVKLYDSLSGIRGPAALTYRVTLIPGTHPGSSGSTTGSTGSTGSVNF